MIAAGVALVVCDAVVKAAVPAAGVDATMLFSIDPRRAVGRRLRAHHRRGGAAPHGRVLGNRVLAGLGTISYGFYLWHVPVLMFLRGHGLLPLDPVLGIAVALGPALAVSALSWVAVERPLIARAARRNERSRAERKRPGRPCRRGRGAPRQAAAASTAAPAGARSAQSAPSQRLPYLRMSSMIGSSARPFSVSTYSTRGGTSA